MKGSITVNRLNWVEVTVLTLMLSSFLLGNGGGSAINIACAAGLTFCVISFSSLSRYRVSWRDGLVEIFRRPLGLKETKWDQITTVQEDHVAYHLFSKCDQLTISKKTAPRDLLDTLAELRHSRSG